MGYVLLDGATDPQHGPGLWLRCGGYSHPGRVEVSGVYPRTLSGELILPSSVLPYGQRETYLRQITVSLSKPIERIARDIERRFVPEYRRLYGLCLAYVVERDARLTTQASNRDRLAALVPGASIGPSWLHRLDRDRTIYIPTQLGQPYGKVEIDTGGESVSRLELSNLSIDDTEWILRFLFERDAPRR
jgi:hypothetical protein